MGSGGTAWDPTDSYSAARLNQKTTFVGTGAQISGLSTTYPGQLVFSTSSESGFTINVLYIRNAANSAWIPILFEDTVEQNSTPISDNADFTVTAGHRYYAFFTMPTAEPLYLITGIEWKNGATVAGTIMSGLDVIDANPPVAQHTPLMGITREITQTGTSAIQRNSVVSCNIVRGGTLVGIWVNCSSSSATLREQTGLGSQNQQKASTYTNSPGTGENTAWTTATARKYLKLYFIGYT